jgi:hypothetical protein
MLWWWLYLLYANQRFSLFSSLQHVWLPIWHTLRIAMDRTFRLFEPDKDGP